MHQIFRLLQRTLLVSGLLIAAVQHVYAADGGISLSRTRIIFTSADKAQTLSMKIMGRALIWFSQRLSPHRIAVSLRHLLVHHRCSGLKPTARAQFVFYAVVMRHYRSIVNPFSILPLLLYRRPTNRIRDMTQQCLRVFQSAYKILSSYFIALSDWL